MSSVWTDFSAPLEDIARYVIESLWKTGWLVDVLSKLGIGAPLGICIIFVVSWVGVRITPKEWSMTLAAGYDLIIPLQYQHVANRRPQDIDHHDRYWPIWSTLTLVELAAYPLTYQPSFTLLVAFKTLAMMVFWIYTSPSANGPTVFSVPTSSPNSPLTPRTSSRSSRSPPLSRNGHAATQSSRTSSPKPPIIEETSDFESQTDTDTDDDVPITSEEKLVRLEKFYETQPDQTWSVKLNDQGKVDEKWLDAAWDQMKRRRRRLRAEKRAQKKREKEAEDMAYAGEGRTKSPKNKANGMPQRSVEESPPASSEEEQGRRARTARKIEVTTRPQRQTPRKDLSPRRPTGPEGLVPDSTEDVVGEDKSGHSDQETEGQDDQAVEVNGRKQRSEALADDETDLADVEVKDRQETEEEGDPVDELRRAIPKPGEDHQEPPFEIAEEAKHPVSASDAEDAASDEKGEVEYATKEAAIRNLEDAGFEHPLGKVMRKRLMAIKDPTARRAKWDDWMQMKELDPPRFEYTRRWYEAKYRQVYERYLSERSSASTTELATATDTSILEESDGNRTDHDSDTSQTRKRKAPSNRKASIPQTDEGKLEVLKTAGLTKERSLEMMQNLSDTNDTNEREALWRTFLKEGMERKALGERGDQSDADDVIDDTLGSQAPSRRGPRNVRRGLILTSSQGSTPGSLQRRRNRNDGGILDDLFHPDDLAEERQGTDDTDREHEVSGDDTDRSAKGQHDSSSLQGEEATEEEGEDDDEVEDSFQIATDDRFPDLDEQLREEGFHDSIARRGLILALSQLDDNKAQRKVRQWLKESEEEKEERMKIYHPIGQKYVQKENKSSLNAMQDFYMHDAAPSIDPEDQEADLKLEQLGVDEPWARRGFHDNYKGREDVKAKRLKVWGKLPQYKRREFMRILSEKSKRNNGRRTLWAPWYGNPKNAGGLQEDEADILAEKYRGLLEKEEEDTEKVEEKVEWLRTGLREKNGRHWTDIAAEAYEVGVDLRKFEHQLVRRLIIVYDWPTAPAETAQRLLDGSEGTRWEKDIKAALKAADKGDSSRLKELEDNFS
ncbi:hypothetical protein M231_02952 [Tremella mesenterica]|uniref:Uncharacterized protein n=1 Tax=Tremella mesenterica TaxID=5217 RepID=A0A4Q1BPE1_TREME|nr:hypothetical protein M231_02952 [Tremella mesenterica]